MQASASVSAPSSPAGALRGVAFIAAAIVCFFLVHTSTFGTFPLYISALGGGEAEIAIIIGLIGPVSLISRPFTGWLIDAWGRKAMLLLGIGLFAVASFAYGLFASFVVLTLLRGMHGAAVGLVNTASNTYVSDIAPPERRGEALGYLSAAQTTAASIGPTIGYAILTVPFFAGVGAFTPWWPQLREPAFAGYNFAALFLFLSGVALLGVAIGSFAPEVPKAASAIKPSLAGFLEKRALLPMAIQMAVVVPFIAALSYLPFFAAERGLENVGLYFTVQAFGTLISGLFLGRVSDRIGRRPVIIVSMFITVGSMFFLASAVNGWMILLAGFVTGFSLGGARTTLAALTADRVPPQVRGAALSTFGMGFDLGTGAAAPVLALAASFWGIGAAFSASGVVVLIGAVASVFFLHDRKWVATEEAPA